MEAGHYPAPFIDPPVAHGLTPLTCNPAQINEIESHLDYCASKRARWGEWSADEGWRVFHLMALSAWAKFGLVTTRTKAVVVMDRDQYIRHLVYAMGLEYLEHAYGTDAALAIHERYALGLGVEPLIPRGRLAPMRGIAYLTPEGRLSA